jgi:hypothetical protein
MSNAQLETAIEAAWEARDTITPATTGETRDAIEDTLNALDGARCAWPNAGETARGTSTNGPRRRCCWASA